VLYKFLHFFIITLDFILYILYKYITVQMKLQRSNEQGSLISLFSGKYLFKMLGNAVKERF